MPKELKPFYNPGPGDIIRDAMEELGWNQADLAEITGLTEKSINLIINNKQAITPETATLLGQVFSTPAEMWLNLQARYDLRKIDDQDSPKKELAEQKAVLRKYMPVGEIKKKGWFQYDVSTIEGIRRECRRVFGQDSVPVKEYEKQKTFAARQTRFDYQYTLWYCHTWFEYAKLNAHEIAEKLPAYNQEKLSQIAGNFASYTLREDGINKIIKEVDNKGVTDKATVEGVNKLGELQTQIYSLNKKGETEIKTRVVTEGVDKAKTDIQQMSESYKKMTSEINKIASMKAELVGLDKNCALEMVVASDVAVDYDRLIDRQLERAAITSTAGFAKIFKDASKVLKI